MRHGRIRIVVVAVLALVASLLPMSLAAAHEHVPVPGGPFVPPAQDDANRSAMLDYETIVDQLFALEARSGGALEVIEIGTSGEGRTLYGAVIGEGDTRMWIQGRIHGNEPYGAEAILDVLQTLVAGGRHAREVLDEMTFLMIPIYNVDGSEAYIRQDVINGIDLNRDWGVAEDLTRPLTEFTAVESQAYWYAWADFEPHYALDLHHQGTYYEAGTDEMTAFSLGIPILPQNLDPAIWDAARQMAVTVFDAIDPKGYANITRYPDINIPEAVISSMMLGGPGPDGEDPGFTTAAMFFETRGGIGTKSRGYLIRQNVEGVWSVIDAIADDTLDEADADRWADLPRRGAFISTGDRFPNSP
jgi:hypothetical protein